MGLVYFGVVTVALLAVNKLIGHEGASPSPPTRRKLKVAHATT